jgi:hypothetical protein
MSAPFDMNQHRSINMDNNNIHQNQSMGNIEMTRGVHHSADIQTKTGLTKFSGPMSNRALPSVPKDQMEDDRSRDNKGRAASSSELSSRSPSKLRRGRSVSNRFV